VAHANSVSERHGSKVSKVFGRVQVNIMKEKTKEINKAGIGVIMAVRIFVRQKDL